MIGVIDILEKLKSPNYPYYIKVYSYVNRGEIQEGIEYIQKTFSCDKLIAKMAMDDFQKYCIEKDTSYTVMQNQSVRLNVPTCPYCRSTNLKKISTASRLLSTGFFGLASSKIGKQFHCNNCGADF